LDYLNDKEMHTCADDAYTPAQGRAVEKEHAFVQAQHKQSQRHLSRLEFQSTVMDARIKQEEQELMDMEMQLKQLQELETRLDHTYRVQVEEVEDMTRNVVEDVRRVKEAMEPSGSTYLYQMQDALKEVDKANNGFHKQLNRYLQAIYPKQGGTESERNEMQRHVDTLCAAWTAVMGSKEAVHSHMRMAAHREALIELEFQHEHLEKVLVFAEQAVASHQALRTLVHTQQLELEDAVSACEQAHQVVQHMLTAHPTTESLPDKDDGMRRAVSSVLQGQDTDVVLTDQDMLKQSMELVSKVKALEVQVATLQQSSIQTMDELYIPT
jgi:hypothetical protein